MITRGKDEKFIPSIAEWGRLYDVWAKKITGELWVMGSRADVLDATQEAFLKIMGLSKKFRLEKPLAPMSVGAWYSCVRQQAKWILGHERAKNRYWRATANTVDELVRELEAADEGAKCRGRRLMGLLVDLEGREFEAELPGDRLDAEWLVRKVRRLVDEVCRTHGVSERHHNAFVRYVLDEMPTAAVAVEVWGATDSLVEIAARRNNLFVIKNRIMHLLKGVAAEWRSRGGNYATFLDVA